VAFQTQPGGGRPRITKGALYLLLAETAFFVVLIFGQKAGVGEFYRDYLMASGQTFWFEGKVWTALTSPLVLLPTDFVKLLFHGLILWMFIPALERWWGMKRLLTFAAWTSATAVVVGTLASSFMGGEQVVLGLDAFIYSSTVAFGVVYARHPVSFFGVLPLTGRQLAIGFCGLAAAFVLFTRQWHLGAGWGAAMGLTWLVCTDRLNPKLSYLRWKQKRLRRHLKIVREENEKKWIN